MKGIKYVVSASVRALLVSVFLSVLFTGCDKEENNYGSPSLIRTIPGDCATAVTKSVADNTDQQDQVIYTVDDGALNLFVGFNGTCCGEYGTSSAIKNDTIFIKIKAIQPGICNCICYYTYTFSYSGITKPFNYSVNIDDYLLFEGSILP